MSTFVLIAGAGLGGWAWQKVARHLQAAGHFVYAPSLTGAGDRKHLLDANVDLRTHVDDIANILFEEDLHDVVLVGHSYGGVVATGTAARLNHRVSRLVYVDAPLGWSHLEIFPDAGNQHMFPRQIIDGVELMVFPSRDLIAFYGITDTAEIEWTLDRLTPHPWKASEQRLEIPDPVALDAVPRYHIVASRTVELGAHDGLPPSERIEGRFFDVNGPHALMVTNPDEITELLIGIASSSAT